MLKNIIKKVPIGSNTDQEGATNLTFQLESPLDIERDIKLPLELRMPRPRFPFNKMPTPFNMVLGFVVAGTILIGACIYYDRMRHRDPDFPRKLKVQRKKNVTPKHHHHIRRVGSAHNNVAIANKVQVKQVQPLHGKRLTVSIPSQKYEDILINEICIAETYMKQQNTEQALIHFATAIAMSYDPSKIISSLRRTLPPLMYNDLAFILNERYDNKFSFMYDDGQLLSRIRVPVPQHSMLYQ